MKQITISKASREFSKLVREVEDTGERVLVLRNGKPAVEIAPAATKRDRRIPTPEQQAAFAAFLDAAMNHPGNSEGVHPWSRDELHER